MFGIHDVRVRGSAFGCGTFAAACLALLPVLSIAVFAQSLGVNHAPIAIAGHDQMVGTSGVQAVTVTLNGAASSDWRSNMCSVPRLVAGALLTGCLGSTPTFSTTQVPSRTEPGQRVIAMEHRWIDATIKGDADAFATFMADEYVAVVANGRIRDKATWVEGVRSSSMKYESVDLRNLKVRLYGETAVVTGEYTQKATSGGQDYSASGAYVTTWLKRNGRWQAIASGFSRAVTQ